MRSIPALLLYACSRQTAAPKQRPLAHALRRYGYHITRETDSHLRLTTQQGGEHHFSIPDHASLRVGTLAGILADVAGHLKIEQLRSSRSSSSAEER